jgi:hypothetical protein
MDQNKKAVDSGSQLEEDGKVCEFVVISRGLQHTVSHMYMHAYTQIQNNQKMDQPYLTHS